MAASVSIRGVSRAFGRTIALDKVDLEIAPGEFIALVGPSGCGKTTLLRMVADLLPPSSGTISVSGKSPREAREARRLGLVSQRPAVLPWKSALADVVFTQRITRRPGYPAAGLLAEFGLTAHEHKRPNQLSGGMLQRVNIASAISHDPDLLLMDEPFSALDEMKREDIGDWLGEELRKRPKTVLFVTHHIDEAAILADRLVVFSRAPGRILDVIEIPSRRPRTQAFRADPLFVKATAHVRGILAQARAEAAMERKAYHD